jgi:hypothetical protein
MKLLALIMLCFSSMVSAAMHTSYLYLSDTTFIADSTDLVTYTVVNNEDAPVMYFIDSDNDGFIDVTEGLILLAGASARMKRPYITEASAMGVDCDDADNTTTYCKNVLVRYEIRD